MRLIRHCGELPPDLKGGVVALGNFDGVHKGHQAVILSARRIAAEMGGPLVVMSFEPHPRTFFKPDQPPFRLTPFRVKARLIEALGADLLVMQHFDAAFASLTAEDFIDTVLVNGLAARHVVVGYDYVFGKGRQGTGALLQKMADAGRFGFTSVPPEIAPDGDVYSSTRVREFLVAGKPGEAAKLLGHYWEVEGRVEHGDARGRTIGFPTANFALGEYQRLERGYRSIPLAGLPDVLAAMYSVPTENGRVKGSIGECYIALVRFTDDGPQIETVQCYGASNREDSPHFDDQMELFQNQLTKTMTLNREQIYLEAKTIYHPQGSARPPEMPQTLTRGRQ